MYRSAVGKHTRPNNIYRAVRSHGGSALGANRHDTLEVEVMDALLALAPDDCTTSLLSLVAPLCVAGVGLGLLGWFVGSAWQIFAAIFDI